MFKRLELETVTRDIPEDAINFREIVQERKMLKTQIKLLHIAAFDRDLKRINDAKKSLSSIALDDFYLTEDIHLVVPIQGKIIKGTKNINDNTLFSYLIYLSYLYGIDFVNLYLNHPTIFYKTILSLNIEEEIKQDLFNLISQRGGNYFSEYIEALNNPIYREYLEEDKKRLSRELK